MNGSEAVNLGTDSPGPSHYQLDRASWLLQSYGILLVFAPFDLHLLYYSANILDFLNISSHSLTSLSLEQLFDAASWERIRQHLPTAAGESKRLKLATRPEYAQVRHFDGTLHRLEEVLLLELEPVGVDTDQADPAAELWALHSQLRDAIARIQQIADQRAFLQAAAVEVRGLTGFDRVMVYQFDSQYAGEVVAEAKREDLVSYLGLHYPATDIPEPSRQLYARGALRYIPDLNAPVVDLVAVEQESRHSALLLPAPLLSTSQFSLSDFSLVELSRLGLRGTDPCCAQYHRNMGVAALMVMGLVKNQRLWGLVSCHHETPKLVPYSVRTVFELLGQMIASELAHKINQAELDDLVRLKSLQSEFVTAIAQIDDLRSALTTPTPRLLDLVSAQGVAICLEGEVTLIGATPTVEQIYPLICWADQQVENALFHTNTLPQQYPPAEAYKQTASGLLLLRISQVRQHYLLWFRPEVVQTVNWAGEPQAALLTTPDGQALPSPRQSFAQWQEIVQSTSLPWKPSELENALNLRHAIVGIVLNKADELTHINQELNRSNQELAAFAYAASHDLKEPLRGIHNYATFLIEDYGEQLDEAGISRLNTLVKLTQRMESLIDVLLKFSQLGQAELDRQPIDLNALLQQVVEVFRLSHPTSDLAIHLPRPLPVVNGDPVLVSEVFSNLLSNAAKYSDKAQPQVEIGYFLPERPVATTTPLAPAEIANRPVFYVRDNGIGIRSRHLNTIFRLFKRLHPQTMYGGGTGAGLTIAKKIVERHGGQIWVESVPGEGSVFYLTLG